MKIFTKSVLVAIAMMAGATTASAQDEWMDPEQWVEVTEDMWFEWKDATPIFDESEPSCSKNAEKVNEAAPAWNLNTDIGAGACILGAENVTYSLYADISEYDKIIMFGTGGPGCRVMCNRVHNEGAWKNLVIGFNADDAHWNADLECIVIDLQEIKEMKLTANLRKDDAGNAIPATCGNAVEEANGWVDGAERVDEFVHLHCLKNAWGGQFPVNVSGVYLWKSGGSAGIKNVKADAQNGAYYNLAGQKVANPQKGLFIQNGKKVILK